MEVEGHCHVCDKRFDAHWSKYSDLEWPENIMNPYCPYCKSDDVSISTDESNEVQGNFEYETEEDYLE